MHIAIEGMDGVGKSTAARGLAARLGFTVVEQPLRQLFDEPGLPSTYVRVRDAINRQVDRDALRAWFYGLGSIYLYQALPRGDVITVRHLASNYYWCGSAETEPIFRCLLGVVGKPVVTFLLHSTVDEASRRLKGRRVDDPDLRKAVLFPEATRKMAEFLERYEMAYEAIDTTHLAPDEVVDVMAASFRQRCQSAVKCGPA